MCGNTRIQNKRNDENTMAISRRKKKITKMIDTRVIHMSMSDICQSLYIFQNIFLCDFDMPKMQKMFYSLRINSMDFYMYMRSVSSTLLLCIKIRQIVGFDSFTRRYLKMIRFKDPEGVIHRFCSPVSNIALFGLQLKLNKQYGRKLDIKFRRKFLSRYDDANLLFD